MEAVYSVLRGLKMQPECEVEGNRVTDRQTKGMFWVRKTFEQRLRRKERWERGSGDSIVLFRIRF